MQDTEQQRRDKEIAQKASLEQERLAKRSERKAFEIWAMKRRAMLNGDEPKLSRPMKVRIAVAKIRRPSGRHTLFTSILKLA